MLAKLSAMPRCISNLQQAQSSLLFKHTVDGFYLPLFQYIAAVDFMQQPGQTDSAEILVAVVKSEIRFAHFRQVAPVTASCYKSDVIRVNRHIQNRTARKLFQAF